MDDKNFNVLIGFLVVSFIIFVCWLGALGIKIEKIFDLMLAMNT